jgi:hypothetical protein
MKLQNSALLVGITAAILAVAGCSSESKKQTTKSPETATGFAPAEPGQNQGQAAQAVAVQPGQPGGVVVQTAEESATVTKLDKEKRKVTLETADGKEHTVKCGPEVVNFDQIQVGDKVKAMVTEQLVVFVRKSGEAPPSPELTTVALAPVGAKPGVMMADTVEATAKVTAIDTEHHKATLQFADGTTKTFKVRDDVDLTKQAVGDEVVLRCTESIAIRVEKP